MKKRGGIVGGIAAVIFVLDQWTKWLVVGHMTVGSRKVVLSGFIDLVHVRNKGAAFGILSQWDSSFRDPIFYLLSVLALVFLWYFLKEFPLKSLWPNIPVGLILGGAFGNIADRVRLGSVVDFVSLHWRDGQASFSLWGHSIEFDLIWPAFNLADSAITVGVFTLVLLLLIDRRKKGVV